MGQIKLATASGGSNVLSPTSTASDTTITIPAINGTMAIQGPAFSAYAGSVSVSANTSTKVPVSTELFDTANCYDNTTNYRFTPNVAGYYQISGSVEASAFASNYFVSQIKKNGTQIYAGSNFPTSASAGPQTSFSCLMYMNGTTDYVELWVQASAGFTVVSGYGTTFQGVMVRAA